MEVSGELYALATLHQGKIPHCPLYGKEGGAQRWMLLLRLILNVLMKYKIYYVLSVSVVGSNHAFVGWHSSEVWEQIYLYLISV
jgi:hypothetical protein